MDKIKVLLVDDQEDFLEVMGVRIKSWGYDLIRALNGKEAIQAVKTKQPDIVILDYIMPVMDGVETLKEIRKVDKDLPVIMFTAHPDMKVQQEVKQLKVSAFIPKLSVYSEVQACLRTALDMTEKKLKKGTKNG